MRVPCLENCVFLSSALLRRQKSQRCSVRSIRILWMAKRLPRRIKGKTQQRSTLLKASNEKDPGQALKCLCLRESSVPSFEAVLILRSDRKQNSAEGIKAVRQCRTHRKTKEGSGNMLNEELLALSQCSLPDYRTANEKIISSERLACMACRARRQGLSAAGNI